ncbi:MAG: hypothetical protein R3Y56_02545 [Akkermansia sp.]
MKTTTWGLLATLTLTLLPLAQQASADIYPGGELKWANRAEDGTSELVNVLFALKFGTQHGGKAYNEAYRDDSQEKGFDATKARAYAMSLIATNANDCVNDLTQECICLCYNPLYLAIELGDVEMTKSLIEHGSSIELNNVCTNDFYFKRDILRNEDPMVQAAYAVLKEAQLKANITPFSLGEDEQADKAENPECTIHGTSSTESEPKWLLKDPEMKQ